MAPAPLPVDLTHHYSRLAIHRIPNAMKTFYKFFQIPGIGNLAGGMFIVASVVRPPWRSCGPATQQIRC